ncbi:hypothetical protein ABT120_03985 [Nonomuraea angiospora]|uniref:hypothetical protein n=1 Tax=Nonomuraea angiospora TaxID=46172 RepID=UPI0033297C45
MFRTPLRRGLAAAAACIALSGSASACGGGGNAEGDLATALNGMADTFTNAQIDPPTRTRPWPNGRRCGPT